MKIGFIAMSGVRACNQELLAMGLTLPGFVERSKVIASLPSLGLLTLAGMTPDPFEIAYLEVADLAAVPDLPGAFDVVAISSFSAQIREAYTLADRYRGMGTKVILGGLHVTARPGEAQAHADAVVVGEAEPVWRLVLADLCRGKLEPIYRAPQSPFDLAESPMPRFDLLTPDRYNRLTIQTQRGCPFNCEFCAASIRLRPGFRAKPVSKVIDELHAIKRIWPHPFIEFADDNTFADKRHGRELVEALAGEEIRWFTETDISIASEPELLTLMRESGCAQILIGLESPSLREVDGLEMKSNWKHRQVGRYRDAVQCIQDHGITVNGCFVLGLDHQDGQAFDNVFRFVEETGLYEVQITVMTPFPETPLERRLRAEGRLLFDGAWERCTLFDVNYRPSQMSVEELEQGFRDLARRIYDTEFIEARRRCFFKRQNELRMARAAA